MRIFADMVFPLFLYIYNRVLGSSAKCELREGFLAAILLI